MSDIRDGTADMKYISYSPDTGWQLETYLAYIDSIRDQVPAHIYDFASDKRNYDLSSHQSLHDAWLEYLCIKERSAGTRRELRDIEIECCFFGPFHDMSIFLTYSPVHAFSLVTPPEFAGPPTSSSGHGDLLMHEVRLQVADRVVHELLFSRGSVFEITCTDFSHRVEPYVRPN